MPRKELAIILALLCCGFLATDSFAQFDRRHPMPQRDPLARLDLSAAQSEEIKTLREAHHTNTLKTRKEIARLENRLEGLLLADDPAEDEIVRLIEEIGAAHTRLRIAEVRLRLAIRKVLTPEQRDRMITHRPPPPPKGPGFERDARVRNR